MKPDQHQQSGAIGGQALLEGVMMRRGECWGAAVRRADGTIATTMHDLPAGLAKWRRIPGVRGVLALGESSGLGTKAMVWAAKERSGEAEAIHVDRPANGYSKGGLALSTVVALALAVGVFGLLPAVIVKLAGVRSAVAFGATEGLIRLAILLGYMALLSLSPQVRRVFQYHGAEHMTIHAFEHRVPLETAEIKAFDRRHPRCGTSFLLLVVAVTIVVNMAIGDPGWGLLITSRILALPVVAGLSYEVIRFAGLHQESWYGRLLMAPGFWLQSLTTREPDDSQIEVAVAALAATLAEPVPALDGIAALPA